jgi:hypothetical protein
VVEELLELLQVEEPVITEIHEDSEEEALMCLSKLAVDGSEGPRTVRLVGQIDDQKVLILVDFGSSQSFMNTDTTCMLNRARTALEPIFVRVANGDTLSCTSMLHDCPCWVQGQTFSTDFRVS